MSLIRLAITNLTIFSSLFCEACSSNVYKAVKGLYYFHTNHFKNIFQFNRQVLNHNSMQKSFKICQVLDYGEKAALIGKTVQIKNINYLKRYTI